LPWADDRNRDECRLPENGADEPKSWGRPWGSPTTRATPFRAEDADMKKLLIISVAVTALLVLALGGWVAGSVRRTPAYA